MKRFIVYICLAIFTIALYENPLISKEQIMSSKIEKKPKYLYKILSLKDWNESQNKTNIVLSSMDEDFIHLSTEEQLSKIYVKYWSHESQFIVLKFDTQQLNGNLVLESNPGGLTKYYHLYDGCLSTNAVVDAKIVNRTLSN